jgi:HlyD family secretion protein
MRPFFRRLFLVLVVLAVAGGLAWSFWPKPVEVDLATIESGPLAVTVNEDGRTRIRERYVVSSPMGGQLIRVELRPGDIVRRGETVVATVRPQAPSMLDARQLARARARVLAVEAAVKRSGKNLNAAKVAFDFAKSEVQRARSVARERVISKAELDNAEMNFRMKSEEYEAANFAAEIARYELEQARAALEYSELKPGAATVTEDYEIQSPIDGLVLRVLQESATVVVPGSTLVELGDPKDLEIEIDVLSSDAVKVRAGQNVIIEHWGGEATLHGRVRLVEPSGFTKISALGVEEQRVNVIVDLNDAPEQRPALGDGFRVEARIVIWESENVVKVPLGALFRRGDEWAVFVVENRSAVLRTIKTGHRSTFEVEVIQGLKPSDRVILHPSDKIQDGVKIVVP